jgi:hypothetical protein
LDWTLSSAPSAPRSLIFRRVFWIGRWARRLRRLQRLVPLFSGVYFGLDAGLGAFDAFSASFPYFQACTLDWTLGSAPSAPRPLYFLMCHMCWTRCSAPSAFRLSESARLVRSEYRARRLRRLAHLVCTALTSGSAPSAPRTFESTRHIHLSRRLRRLAPLSLHVTYIYFYMCHFGTGSAPSAPRLPNWARRLRRLVPLLLYVSRRLDVLLVASSHYFYMCHLGTGSAPSAPRPLTIECEI